MLKFANVLSKKFSWLRRLLLVVAAASPLRPVWPHLLQWLPSQAAQRRRSPLHHCRRGLLHQCRRSPLHQCRRSLLHQCLQHRLLLSLRHLGILWWHLLFDASTCSKCSLAICFVYILVFTNFKSNMQFWSICWCLVIILAHFLFR